MNVFRKAFEFFQRRPLTIDDPTGWPTDRDNYTGESVTETSILALTTAWACINLLAGTQASLPCEIYREDANGMLAVASDHELYRLLHDSPNADQTAYDFWEFICAALEINGNAYARKFFIGKKLVSLIPIHPEGMSVRALENGRLKYSWSAGGKSYSVLDDEMLHIRGFGGNRLGGISTIAAGRHAFGLAAAINKAAGSTFKNGLRPSGAIKFPTFLTKEQRAELEPLIMQKFAGAANAGRPFLFEGGGDWVPLTMKPEDAQMLQSRAFSVEEICRIFGVPPFMVGHTEKNTSFGKGLSEQVLGFQKFALRRRSKRIEMALEKQLLSAEDRARGIRIRFNFDALMRADSAGRSAFYEKMIRAGVMTINEARALENLPPVDGGDVIRLQSQNVPITDVPALGHNGGPPLEDDE